MSYQRTMTGSVYWSTSGSVHYPASETGGSVGYSDSGTVPVTITVHVDTTPFDESVVGCNAEVAALGTSVVAMNAAQCEAIKNTSDTVSSHITGGFFTLVKSELSQNMAALFARLNSGIMLVMEKTKSAVKQRDIMQSDYKRAASRYTKVFSDLDEECRRRIAELDKEAMQLSRDVLQKQIADIPTAATANSLTYANDGEKVDARLFAAYIKSKTLLIIERVARHIIQQGEYTKQMTSLLRADGVLEAYKAKDTKEVFVPVLYTERLAMEDKSRQDAATFVAQGLDTASIEQAVRSYLASTAARWHFRQDEADAVRKAFMRRTEEYLKAADGTDAGEVAHECNARRVYDTMMTLAAQETQRL